MWAEARGSPFCAVMGRFMEGPCVQNGQACTAPRAPGAVETQSVPVSAPTAPGDSAAVQGSRRSRTSLPPTPAFVPTIVRCWCRPELPFLSGCGVLIIARFGVSPGEHQRGVPPPPTPRTLLLRRSLLSNYPVLCTDPFQIVAPSAFDPSSASVDLVQKKGGHCKLISHVCGRPSCGLKIFSQI